MSRVSELAERIETYLNAKEWWGEDPDTMLRESATLLREMEEALRPFAEVGRMLSDEDGWTDTDCIQLGADPEYPQFHEMPAADFRRARNLIGGRDEA